jgi:hypothetical protein
MSDPAAIRYVDRFDNGSIRHRGPFLTPVGAPRSNWRIVQPDDDEPYLELTVWHGLNAMHPAGGFSNERTEYITPYDRTPIEGRTFHYGFRVRYPGYRKVNARHMLTQFKVNMREGVNPSPIVGIYLETGQGRNLEKIKVCHAYDYETRKSVCENFLIGEDSEHFPLLPPDEWIALKLSIYVTREDDGWIVIGKNGRTVWNYSGPTNYRNTVFDKFTIRFGLYRDSGPGGAPHEEAVAHFRDFAFSTDEAFVDEILGWARVSG